MGKPAMSLRRTLEVAVENKAAIQLWKHAGKPPLQKVKDVLPTNGIDFYTHPLREATREVLQFWHMSKPALLLRKNPRLFLV
jgi:hypothetical protein